MIIITINTANRLFIKLLNLLNKYFYFCFLMLMHFTLCYCKPDSDLFFILRSALLTLSLPLLYSGSLTALIKC